MFHFSKKCSFHYSLNNYLPFSFPSPPLNFIVWFGKAISDMTARVVRHSSLSLTNFHQIFQPEFKAATWLLWKLVSHKMADTILILPLKKRQAELSIWQLLLGCSVYIHYLMNLCVLSRVATGCTVSHPVSKPESRLRWTETGNKYKDSLQEHRKALEISQCWVCGSCSGMGGYCGRCRTLTHHKSGFHCSFACRLAAKTKLTVYTTSKLHPPQMLRKRTLTSWEGWGFLLHSTVSHWQFLWMLPIRQKRTPVGLSSLQKQPKSFVAPQVRASTSYLQRNFQTHSVLLPMKPCCTDLGIGLHSLKFPSPFLPLINNWGWPLLRKPPTAKCEISA